MAVSRRIAADVVVIGAGIVGTAIARELSRYDVSVVLVEKKSDVASGTTKANTALVHAGYDAEPGTLNDWLNVAGYAVYPKVCAELGVLYYNNGSLVVHLMKLMFTSESSRPRERRTVWQGLKLSPESGY